MKICILGNCQAQHLEMMVRIGNPQVTVERLAPVFLMTAANQDMVQAALSRADVIFAQRVAQDFHLAWLSSAELRAAFGSKVVVWPNMYFDGLFPGIQYIYRQGRGKVVGPLSDYHFGQIAYCHKEGRTVEEAVLAFSGEGLFAKTADPVGASLAQLRSREDDSDLRISDFIEENFARKRYFYTPNHPTNELLGEMLRRLGASIDLELDIEKAVQAPYRLDQVYIPASAAIVRRLDLPYDHEPSYLGQEVVAVTDSDIELGAPRRYGTVELATAFYRLYDQMAGRA